jgi:FtsH-binding integral membrane protein
MAYAQAAQRRPIPGAVATLGVSDRVSFLRKTYAHLGVSLIAFALLTGAIFKFAPDLSWKVATVSPFIAFILFVVANIAAQRLAMSETSRGLQYLGLVIMVGAWSLIMQNLIWFVMIKFAVGVHVTAAGTVVPAASGTAMAIIAESVVITLAIFIGLTATVFITRKDFTFLRGILSIATFAIIGVILASFLFGFTLGALMSGVIVLLMAGYILHQTSLVMSYFPPTSYVAAALMLFGTVATLFMHVLNIMASMRNN